MEISRRKDPPSYLIPLDWRMLAAGVVGDAEVLRRHWRSWPAVALVSPTEAEAALTAFEARGEPTHKLELAEVFAHAETILLGATTPDILVIYASRVARKLLEWYPRGQMLAWGKSMDYLREARPGHLLAGLQAGGWGGVQRALAVQSGGLWFAGEDLSTSQPAALYLNLVNGYNLPGAAITTLPITFIFEFGTYINDDQPLDFLGIRYIHSLSDMTYMSASLPQHMVHPQPGLFHQDPLREWFVARFNTLADRLIRLEEYITVTGEVRPLVMQQTAMTVNRILNTTGHLLASQEKGSRYSALWDLVDLYGSLAGSVTTVFSQRYWERRVVATMGTLPGDLGPLFEQYAIDLYKEFVSEVVEGVTDPTRRTSKSVYIDAPGGRQRLSHATFFERYMHHRRNTLHGYDLSRPGQREFLAIHDGRLPVRLPEWGRLVFIALLAEPRNFFDRRFLAA